MRARTFRVPFSRVAPEAVELEWGPDDYLVVHPLLSRSPAAISAVYAALTAATSNDTPEDERDELLTSIFDTVIVEWSLRGEDGESIARPSNWAEMDALPRGLAMALFDFIFTYRGDGPADPTPAGTPS